MLSAPATTADPDADDHSVGPRLKLGRDVFTTGQIAAVCGVSCRTAAKWIDSGKIKGHRIPGCQDRRVYRDELIRFARQHEIRLRIEPKTVTVFAPAAEGEAVSAVRLGVMLARADVSASVIGCADGLAAAVALAREVRAIDPTVRLTLQLGEDRGPEDVPAGVFDEVRS